MDQQENQIRGEGQGGGKMQGMPGVIRERFGNGRAGAGENFDAGIKQKHASQDSNSSENNRHQFQVRLEEEGNQADRFFARAGLGHNADVDRAWIQRDESHVLADNESRQSGNDPLEYLAGDGDAQKADQQSRAAGDAQEREAI